MQINAASNSAAARRSNGFILPDSFTVFLTVSDVENSKKFPVFLKRTPCGVRYDSSFCKRQFFRERGCGFPRLRRKWKSMRTFPRFRRGRKDIFPAQIAQSHRKSKDSIDKKERGIRLSPFNCVAIPVLSGSFLFEQDCFGQHLQFSDIYCRAESLSFFFSMALVRIPRISAHATEVIVIFPKVRAMPPTPAIRMMETTNKLRLSPRSTV